MNKTPTSLLKALSALPQAKAQWASLTPVARRDFSTWITAAKQEQTRARRIAKACSVLAAGKRRPCCYARVPMDLYRSLDENAKAKTQWKSLSPDERRDIVDRIEQTIDKEMRRQRLKKACAALANGRRKI